MNRKSTEQKIKEYIVNKPGCKEEDFTVKEIPTSENRLRRFLVTAPFNMLEKIYATDFWPEGVGIRRFDFVKHKDFLSELGGDFL